MKKFTTICMAFIIMLMMVLTGCAGFTINKVDYYNEIVAKVGEQNITRFDLINAYNSYGYTNFVTQQGQTEKEALRSTIDLLIERKMLVQYAKENQDKYKLSEYEINNVFKETLDYMLENFEENLNTARKIYGIEKVESDTTDETVDAIKLSEYRYEKRVQVAGETLQYIDTDTDEIIDEYALDEDTVANYKDYTEKAIVSALLNKFKQTLYTNVNNEENYSKICDKAVELACNNLISYEYYLRDEDGEKFSTNQESLLFRYVQRTYESQLETAYITKVNNEYLKYEEISTDKILDAFKTLYRRDYARYNNDTEAYEDKIISTDSELIYYHPDGDGEFGYFLHALLPFNNVEDDLKELQEYKYILPDDEYQSKQQELISKITCVERTLGDVYEEGELIHEEGVVLEDEIAIQDVLNEYRATVVDEASFINFMFKYTTDTATLTADMPYIIGYNTATYTGEVEDGKVVGAYSSMVTNFTKEAIRLMQNNIEYTDVNDYILTNYGIHLLYYVGKVDNKITYNDLATITINDLEEATLNKVTGETYLDRVFDLVYPAGTNGMFSSNTNYNEFEVKLIDSLYSKYPVVLYTTKIDASTKI